MSVDNVSNSKASRAQQVHTAKTGVSRYSLRYRQFFAYTMTLNRLATTPYGSKMRQYAKSRVKFKSIPTGFGRFGSKRGGRNATVGTWIFRHRADRGRVGLFGTCSRGCRNREDSIFLFPRAFPSYARGPSVSVCVRATAGTRILQFPS